MTVSFANFVEMVDNLAELTQLELIKVTRYRNHHGVINPGNMAEATFAYKCPRDFVVVCDELEISYNLEDEEGGYTVRVGSYGERWYHGYAIMSLKTWDQVCKFTQQWAETPFREPDKAQKLLREFQTLEVKGYKPSHKIIFDTDPYIKVDFEGHGAYPDAEIRLTEDGYYRVTWHTKWHKSYTTAAPIKDLDSLNRYLVRVLKQGMLTC